MLVANSFDLWQKDTFFLAAEEVQRSADIMESAFRTWQRERKETSKSQYWDELSRELQMALGTAKWQLEEFERAVRLSYRRNADEVTMTRHRQFISVIEEQIFRVEEALRESFAVDGKQPLRWVNLDKQERDDLALFLSGHAGSSPRVNDGDIKQKVRMSSFQLNGSTKKHLNPNVKFGREGDNTNSSSSENISSDTDAGFVASLDSKPSPSTRDVSSQTDIMVNTEITRSLPDLSMLEIVIDDKGRQEETSTRDIESTPKEKGFKPHFWMLKHGDSLQSKAGALNCSNLRRIHWINQVFGRLAGIRRQSHSYRVMSFTCSPRFVLVLMLAVFLVVPFLFYSS